MFLSFEIERYLHYTVKRKKKFYLRKGKKGEENKP